MTRLKNAIFIVSLFMISLPMAAWPQETMTLTLEQSVEMALDRNLSLQIAEKELTKSKASVWEAYTAILPTLDGSASLRAALWRGAGHGAGTPGARAALAVASQPGRGVVVSGAHFQGLPAN